MSPYNTILERRFPLVGNTDRPWVQHNRWPPYYDSSPQQLTFHHSAPSDYNTWEDNVNSPHTSAINYPQTIIAPHPYAFTSWPDYPESSQRTVLTSSPDDIEAGVLHPIYDHRRSQSSNSSDYNHATLWDATTLSDNFQYPVQEMHTEDTEEAMVETQCSQSSPPVSVSVAPSLHPSVKVEPDDPDGCFIMEFSSMSSSLAHSVSGMNQTLAPLTEVPLRSQAPPEQQKRMCTFRVDIFHDDKKKKKGPGVLPAPWHGGGPLEEEPLIFEFQLDIVDDPGATQFDHVGIPSGASGSGASGSPTGEEAQLRSFSPSFELHPEDLRSDSDMGEEHEQEQEDCPEPDQQNEWSDTSSTTHSVHTPSEARSTHTPFNESSVYQYPIAPSVASTWDIDPYQAHGEEYLPPTEKMEGGHKMHRVHTTSHPYLRRSLAASPSSSTHSLSQSHPHLHTHTQLNFAYPLLQHPTHHQHQHYNQVPSQNHSQNHSQSYSQHPTVHDSMISAPPPNLELIPVSSHRPENSMYSPYPMRSGRTLKLAEDETSNLHHHLVNEYTPRGTASNAYTGQHYTNLNASGYQYEPSSYSSSEDELSPPRRWSLPETIGGPYRSTM